MRKSLMSSFDEIYILDLHGNAMKKEKCPDCEYCQACSETRCRVCREEGHKGKPCELGSSFTYEDYLEWKNRKCR